MKKMVAIVVLLALATTLLPAPAHAGAATSVALGLAAFAVFNQLVMASVWAGAAYRPRVVVTGPYDYLADPTPSSPSEVVYPHGKYVLRGDGVTSAYQWLWVPNPPPAPPTARD